jgi:RimJ/RimL family protein N-acetyltransferase
VSRVPEDQIDIVVSTSSIPRQLSTLKLQANVGIMNPEGELCAWGYLGIDGSLATLYVLPEYRGKGLATQVAVELLTRLERGEFSDLGYAGKSGYVHSDVKVGNEGSEGVMKSIGGKVEWQSAYLHVDSDRFTGYVHSMVQAGNTGSEGVMKSLGGTVEGQGNKVFVDIDKF